MNIGEYFDFNTAPKQHPDVERIIRHNTHDLLRKAMRESGYEPPHDILGDGIIQRFQGPNDRNKDSWLFFYDDDHPYAQWGSWRTDDRHEWMFGNAATDPDYAPRIEAARALREEVLRQGHEEAHKRAYAEWTAGTDVTVHPYLEKKGVRSFGLRILHGSLLIPATDADGRLWTLQRIDASGEKRFIYKGKKKGTFFTIPGKDAHAIAEGYATAASVHMATGWTVHVAFDKGNLLPVAEAIRAMHPGARIVVCGDVDPDGGGQRKAEEAAKVVHGTAAMPEGLPPGGSDWNDLHAHAGLQEVGKQLHAGSKMFAIAVHDWHVSRFSGPPPERKWLVQKIFPMGALSIVAAAGDAGKGMLTLDLALKVAGDRRTSHFDPLQAFSGDIVNHGSVVMILAEDDHPEVHRRVYGLGARCTERLFIVPLPNAGGPSPFIVPGKNGPETTPQWHGLVAQLKTIPDLAMIVFDPLASFVMADVNADPAAGAFTTGLFASLATETGAAVIVCHHMAKTKTQVKDPEEARALVRGSTALVDGSRCVYVLWQVDEKECRATCRAINVEVHRNRVFKGCVVKSNGPADREIKTYVRNDVGLLEARNDIVVAGKKITENKNKRLLVEVIRQSVDDGFPFTKTGANGLDKKKKARLPDVLQGVAWRELIRMVDDLIANGELVHLSEEGKAETKWLGTPGQRLIRDTSGAEEPTYTAMSVTQ